MAITTFATGGNQAITYWSKTTMRQVLKNTLFGKFMGKGKTAIIQQLSELEKSPGDTIKYDLLMQMGNDGVTGDNVLKGNEEALTYYQDSVVLDQLRNAHAFRRMSQQRSLHDLRMDARDNLSDWFTDKMETYMMNNLCGNASFTFGQAAVAPDTNHYILAGDVSKTGTIATDESSLGTNDQISLHDLDYAKELAETGTVPIRPAMIEGDRYFVVVLHPYSVVDLRLNARNLTAMTWQDIQQYANVRGLKNPLFSGALGVYNNMILFSSNYIYSPTTSVRRNLLLGAQAGVFALGNAYDNMDRKMYGNLPMSWTEEISDFGNEKGIAVGCVFGMTATRFNSADYGKIVISSYAAAHSS